MAKTRLFDVPKKHEQGWIWVVCEYIPGNPIGDNMNAELFYYRADAYKYYYYICGRIGSGNIKQVSIFKTPIITNCIPNEINSTIGFEYGMLKNSSQKTLLVL